MLEIDSLYFAYGQKPILNGISFSVIEGEIVALIGISGSGKTTLFRLITGLVEPSMGQITIAGKPALKEGAPLTTYMRQEDLLLPWRTVLENLLLFTELGKTNKARSKEKVIEEAHTLLKQVGLDGCAQSYPDALSGGMRQRVALARALLQNRPLMLLDEPFASLDVIIREQLYLLMRDIRDQYRKTIIMVTHDFRDAIALADRILILSQGVVMASYEITSELKSDPHAANQLIEQIREILSAAL
ncbi:MAG: ABC transporter ATP-binding protein [Chlamydiales bacterium]|nr:ABC transporter ATP-binding protein [Chlamydiales bacterium]